MDLIDDAGQEVRKEAKETLPPPPGHPRFPHMDGLRAIAAIGVLVVHVGILTGGFEPVYKQLLAHLDMGVPIFFLLSGFLLYRPMVASRQLGIRHTRLRDYARNRFVRIFPPYWVVLTAAAIVPGMYGAFTDNWWVYYALLDNLPVYTREGACANDLFRCGVPPAWSLGIEILFYATLPIYAFAMARLVRLAPRERWWTIEAAGLFALAAVSFLIQGNRSGSDLQQWLFFSPLGRGWWFALGMGLAVLSVLVQQHGERPRWLTPLATRPGWTWLAAAALYAFMSLVLLEPGPSLAGRVIPMDLYLTQYFLTGVISLLLVAPAVFASGRRDLVARFLAHPVIAWLGLISYGIFLWHFPVLIALLDAGVLDLPGPQLPLLLVSTLAVTVALAALSFYALERPLLRWSHRLSPGPRAPGGRRGRSRIPHQAAE